MSHLIVTRIPRVPLHHFPSRIVDHNSRVAQRHASPQTVAHNSRAHLRHAPPRAATHSSIALLHHAQTTPSLSTRNTKWRSEGYVTVRLCAMSRNKALIHRYWAGGCNVKWTRRRGYCPNLATSCCCHSEQETPPVFYHDGQSIFPFTITFLSISMS